MRISSVTLGYQSEPLNTLWILFFVTPYSIFCEPLRTGKFRVGTPIRWVHSIQEISQKNEYTDEETDGSLLRNKSLQISEFVFHHPICVTCHRYWLNCMLHFPKTIVPCCTEEILRSPFKGQRICFSPKFLARKPWICWVDLSANGLKSRPKYGGLSCCPGLLQWNILTGNCMKLHVFFH